MDAIAILTSLSQFNPVSLAILIFGVGLFIIIIQSSRITSRTIKIAKLHEKMFAQWLRYVDNKLLEILTTSTSNAKKVIDSEYIYDVQKCDFCKSSIKHNTPDAQLSMFNNRLRDTLMYGEVKHALKDAYRVNGFYEMSDSEFREYCSDKTTGLISIAVDAIHRTLSEYSYLSGRHSDIMSRDFCFEYVKSIFDKAKSIKNELKYSELKIVAETSIIPTKIAEMLSVFYKSSI